ncbi:MAG: C25 family cysteine peptidase [Thermoplasmatota archaeon]
MRTSIVSAIMLCIILNSFSSMGSSTYDHQTQILTNPYDLVIIAPQAFLPTIQPLIDHKNHYGIKTFLKTTEDIYSEYTGTDRQEQIRTFIKDAIEQYGITYVLLMGDITCVPIRKTALSWDYYGNIVVPDVITDLYYSDIYDANGSMSLWDTNQDGTYSEIRMIMNDRPYNETVEIIDTFEAIPDIIVGRLPCSTIQDVQQVVKKIITYETTTYGSDWFHRLILLGGDTFPHTGGISEGEVVTEYISSQLLDFTPIKLWTSLHTFHPMNINTELSKGAGFVSYSGHGFEFGLATSNRDSTSTIHYYLPYIIGIRNKERYPIMYFDACLTGALDYQKFHINVPCFAWSMIKKHDSGAVACIAATRVGFGGFEGNPMLAGASCLHAYFYEAYTPGIHLGEMFIQAQRRYIQNVMHSIIYDPLTLQEFSLLGDPTLKIGGYEVP